MIFSLTNIVLGLTISGNVHVFNEDMGNKMKEQIRNTSVKSVSGYTFHYVNNGLSKNGYKSTVEVFDASGNRLQELEYNKKGESIAEYIYTFDQNGKETQNIGLVNTQPQYNYWEYTFNDTTKTLRKAHADKRNKEYWLIQYDEQGRKIKETYFTHTGYQDWESVYTYDAVHNRLIEKNRFDSYGNLYSRVSYEYDENGNNTNQTFFDSQKTIFRQFKMVYDQKNNISTKIEMDGNGKSVSMTVYTYEFF
jgi:hypothetical protein